MRLPQELKNKTYELVCGGRTIHIRQSDRGTNGRIVMFNNRIYYPKTSEKALKEMFLSEADNQWYAPDRARRYRMCQPSQEDSRPTSLSTALLRTCK